MAPPMETMR